MTSPPLDYTKLREIAERATGLHGADREHIFDVAAEFNDTFGVEVVLALLADNARMREVLEDIALTASAASNSDPQQGLHAIWDSARRALSGASDHAD